MEKDEKKLEAEKKMQKKSEPASGGILVGLVKKLLSINFLKWGVKKDF